MNEETIWIVYYYYYCFHLFLGTLGRACWFFAYKIDKQTVCDLGYTQGKTDNGWGFASDQLDCSNFVCCYWCTVHATYGWARRRWPIRLVCFFGVFLPLWLLFGNFWLGSTTMTNQVSLKKFLEPFVLSVPWYLSLAHLPL